MFHEAAFWILLVVAVPLFWLLPRSVRFGFLGLVSAGFLFRLAPFSVAALSAWIVLFHLLAPAIVPGRPHRLRISVGAVLALLGFLAYFKYVPPIVEALSDGTRSTRILIPLGISYYTFKLIHYVIEVARGSIRERSFQQFFCYMMLFPIFTAGPIERFDHFLAGQEHSLSRASLVEGVWRIVVGLIKRFVLAQALDEAMFQGATSSATLPKILPELSTPFVWLYAAATYLYIYLDFSAYTDIALGSSRLFGMRIMENFAFPVVAADIRDYWRRWHISLSAWCQSYIYMPVLGLYRKPLVSLYLTFFVMGLWHEGSWNRIGWGLYHATGVAIYTAWNRYRRGRKWKVFDRPVLHGVAILCTQLFVSGSMCFLILDREQGIHGSMRLLAKLVFIDLP